MSGCVSMNFVQRKFKGRMSMECSNPFWRSAVTTVGGLAPLCLFCTLECPLKLYLRIGEFYKVQVNDPGDCT